MHVMIIIIIIKLIIVIVITVITFIKIIDNFIKKTIKILFTINSLKKKEKTIHSKTLFTISVDLKST